MGERYPQLHPPPSLAGEHILVVEADTALRRVIGLGLRHRGFKVIEARTLGEAWDRTTVTPAAIVLDVGLGTSSEWMLLRALGGHAALRQAPLVLLAWECPATVATAPAARGSSSAARICLTKPFDARALFAAVERLVATPALPGAVAALHGDASFIVERQAAGASPWPLMAAGAATLAVAGFLVRPAFAIAGLVLLVVALLWWSTSSAEPAASG